MNKVKKGTVYVAMEIVIVFTLIISIFPLLWVMLSAFKTNAEILEGPFTLPESLDFSAFQYLFEKYDFFQYFLNSIYVTAVSVVVSLIIFTMAGYVLARYEFKGKMLIFSLLMITMLIPGYAKTQPLFQMITDMGLYDTKEGLILIYISNGMATSVFLLRNAFQSLPKELSESARLDGAGFFRTFFTINLPLIRGSIATAGILMFLGNWNEYYFASILITSEYNNTLPIITMSFTSKFSYNYTLMFAAITLVIIPGLIIYAIAQEQVQQSLASSGIKG